MEFKVFDKYFDLISNLMFCSMLNEMKVNKRLCEIGNLHKINKRKTGKLLPK